VLRGDLIGGVDGRDDRRDAALAKAAGSVELSVESQLRLVGEHRLQRGTAAFEHHQPSTERPDVQHADLRVRDYASHSTHLHIAFEPQQG
jgi:hypothetical protein